MPLQDGIDNFAEFATVQFRRFPPSLGIVCQNPLVGGDQFVPKGRRNSRQDSCYVQYSRHVFLQLPCQHRRSTSLDFPAVVSLYFLRLLGLAALSYLNDLRRGFGFQNVKSSCYVRYRNSHVLKFGIDSKRIKIRLLLDILEPVPSH